MKGIAIGLTVLLLGIAACGFIAGEIIKSATALQGATYLPFIFYGLAGITLIVDIFAIYKAATYKGY